MSVSHVVVLLDLIFDVFRVPAFGALVPRARMQEIGDAPVVVVDLALT